MKFEEIDKFAGPLRDAREAIHDAPDHDARDAAILALFEAAFDAGWDARIAWARRKAILGRPEMPLHLREPRPWWRFW